MSLNSAGARGRLIQQEILDSDEISHLITQKQAGWCGHPAVMAAKCPPSLQVCRLLAFGFCPAGSSHRDDKAELRQSFMKSNLLKADKESCLSQTTVPLEVSVHLSPTPTLNRLFSAYL